MQTRLSPAVLRAPVLALTLAACAAPMRAPLPVLIATAPAPTAPPAPLTPAQIAARSTPAVVSIRSATGLGTGFVVREDGWIATNLHVIAGARELVVTTSDRREFSVLELIAADEPRDLAVVRVDAKELAVLALGDSEAVRAGDAIVAIGHPLGLEDTVTNGLVSAVRVLDPALTVLQISAPIAPGSSGGPIFSDRGEVIGVATAFIAEGQNLNFGVPARYLKTLLDAPRPMPLATFAAATARPVLPTVRREVPAHDVKLLAGCSDGELEKAARVIAEAIEVGAPVYNERHFAACYHIYDGAALEVEKKLPAACKGPKKAMRDGRARAGKLDDASAQAWAMRDAFDGLLDVIERRFSARKRP